AEVQFLARGARLSVRETLQRLMAAGMASLPGAGAEILDNDWRKTFSPGKCSATEWIQVMQTAHQMGLLSSATMMYGYHDTPSLRIKHLFAIRDLQASTGGFRAFIAWPYQGPEAHSTMSDYLRMVAIARIVLDNVPNIQASWLTVGRSAAQMALHGGANDMGSIMIEENVVRSAGSTNTIDASGIQRTIVEAGFEPALRDQAYNLL
ncbi:MAG: dehypoxanthine futalosine cyclase, partial [Mucinivorans sp.]